MGYAGIIDSNGVWIDEGVIDVVVLQDWNNQQTFISWKKEKED